MMRRDADLRWFGFVRGKRGAVFGEKKRSGGCGCFFPNCLLEGREGGEERERRKREKGNWYLVIISVQ